MTGIRRWLIGACGAVVLVWALLLIVTPYVAAHGHAARVGTLVAAGSYLVGAIVCHQRPERSFFLWGTQVPVCARCSGLYAAAPLGFLSVVGAGRRRRAWAQRGGDAPRRWTMARIRVVLLASALPTAVTVGAEWVGVAEPTNLTRMIAALPLGASVAWIVGLALAGAVDEGA